MQRSEVPCRDVVSHMSVIARQLKAVLAVAGVLFVLSAGCDRNPPTSTSTLMAGGGAAAALKPAAVSLDELAMEYQQSVGQETRRRDVAIRTIDCGYIGVGTPMNNVWRLFGSDFGMHAPGVVTFLPQMSSRTDKGGVPVEGRFSGWSMFIDHNTEHVISVELTNTDKQISPPGREDTLTLEELAVCYQTAMEGMVKRDICLRAIDAGYVGTMKPVTNVKLLCGTDFEEAVGKNRLGTDYGVVRFGVASGGADGAGVHRGLQLVVFYAHGKICDYHLAIRRAGAQIRPEQVPDVDGPADR